LGIITIDLTRTATERKPEKFKPGRRKGGDDEDTSYNTSAVIAIDPGGTTGWSFLCVEPYALSDPEEKVLGNITTHLHGELSSNVQGNSNIGEAVCVDDLWEFIDAWPQAAIVIEDFVIRNNDRSRQFLSPVRITAQLEWLCWKYQRKHFRQTPADAKTTVSDDRLKAWRLYESEGGLGHARDADRHAILFLRRAKQDEHLRAMAWPHLYDPETGLYTT
jgi:hypothetical protein